MFSSFPEQRYARICQRVGGRVQGFYCCIVLDYIDFGLFILVDILFFRKRAAI